MKSATLKKDGKYRSEKFFIRYQDGVVDFLSTENPAFLEIWMCSLGNNGGSVQCGNRPVLIVSNDTNNRHSTTVNVMPMTTKMNKRNLPCHVVLENFKKYGLTAPSTIMVEQITTIQKENLMYRMGAIDDKETMMEILKAMQVQFPFIPAK